MCHAKHLQQSSIQDFSSKPFFFVSVKSDLVYLKDGCCTILLDFLLLLLFWNLQLQVFKLSIYLLKSCCTYHGQLFFLKSPKIQYHSLKNPFNIYIC